MSYTVTERNDRDGIRMLLRATHHIITMILARPDCWRWVVLGVACPSLRLAPRRAPLRIEAARSGHSSRAALLLAVVTAVASLVPSMPRQM